MNYIASFKTYLAIKQDRIPFSAMMPGDHSKETLMTKMNLRILREEEDQKFFLEMPLITPGI